MTLKELKENSIRYFSFFVKSMKEKRQMIKKRISKIHSLKYIVLKHSV